MFKLLLVAVCLLVIEVNSKPYEPCTRTDLYPDPDDCTKFWQCAPYGPQIQTCALGTVFNPDIQRCDWPQNVDCSRKPKTDATTIRTTEAPTTTTEAPTTTTEAPTTTTEAPTTITEVPVTEPETREPETETPEPETETPEPETETPEPETETPEPETETPEPETETPEPETETPEPETKTPEPETEAPVPETTTTEAATTTEKVTPQSTCKRYPDAIFIAAHPTACNKFITCHHGLAIILECPDDKFYIPELQYCVADESVCNRQKGVIAHFI